MVELLPAGPGPLSTCVDQISMMSPSPQVGQPTVIVSFVPQVNYARVDAVEVEQE
jgi:hypothetical protein